MLNRRGSWVSLTVLVLFACAMEPPAKSPTAGMGLAASLDYSNQGAAGHNADGLDHLVREHWKKAAADFRRALGVDPDFAVAHFNLGLVLTELGQSNSAADHFERAAALAPGDSRIADNPILKKQIEGPGASPGSAPSDSP